MVRWNGAEGRTSDWVLFFILVLFSIPFHPLFWCFCPGFLLLLSPVRREVDVVEMLGFAIVLSIAFWITASWTINSAGLSIRPFAYGVVTATLVITIILRKRIPRGEIEMNREDRIVLLLLGITALLRFVPMALVEVPPGADMSMHTYLTRLIVRSGSIPETFEPLLPLELSSSYALGFHYLSALASLVTGVPVHRACLIVTCLSHALFPVTVYLLARRFADRWAALATAIIASFVCNLPQSLIGPGSNPTALAVDFLVIASTWIIDLNRPISWTRRIVLAIILSAAPLTHAIPSAGYAFVIVPVVLARMIHSSIKGRESTWHLVRNGLAIGLLVGLMTISYLESMEVHLSQGEINWVRNWQNIAFIGTLRDLPFGLEAVLGGILLVPLALEEKLGLIFLLISALGLVIVIIRREKDRYPFILYSFLLLLLILNGKYWLLPLSYVLYPDRLAILLAIPLSLLGTSAISWTLSRAGGKVARAILLTGLIAISGWFCAHRYLLPTVRLTAVSDADMRAFRWIDENVEKDAVFLNNYGDAGLWIPAMVLRPTVIIQTNPVYMEEIRRLQLRLPTDYVYIGAKRALKNNISLKKDEFEAMPEICRKIYDRDGAVIFESLDPAALRNYFWNRDDIRRRVELNRKIMGFEGEEK